MELILNKSEVVKRIRSLHKLLSSYRDRDTFRTLSEHWVLQKEECLSAGAQPQISQDKEFMEGSLWN